MSQFGERPLPCDLPRHDGSRTVAKFFDFRQNVRHEQHGFALCLAFANDFALTKDGVARTSQSVDFAGSAVAFADRRLRSALTEVITVRNGAP